MRAYAYAWEKLFNTVLTLAKAEGSVQERLARAWLRYGTRLTIPSTPCLPDQLQSDLDEIHAALIGYSQDDTQATANILAMSSDEAGAWVRRIVGLYDDLCQVYYRAL